MKVILGIQSVDEGSISKPKEMTLGYLPQELKMDSSEAIFEEVLKTFEVTRKLEARIDAITKEVAEREDGESGSNLDLAEELNRVSTQLGIYDVDSQDEQVERVLLGLGFSKEEFSRPLNSFSGGWQMRVALAKLLLKKPDLLMLDEPTNHLDIESIEWLEEYLKSFPGAILLISHDRRFLDQITNRTVELVKGNIYDYPVPYSKFLDLRADVIEKQRQAQKNQDKEIKQTEDLINRFRAKSSKAAFAQSLIKKLDRMERIEVDEEDETGMDFRFQPAPRSGKVVVKGEDISKSYGSKQVLRHMSFEIHRGQRVALIGKNGVGKTTLTRVLAGLTAYEGECELGHNVDLGYYSQNQSDELPGELTVLEVIDREATGEYRKKVRNLLGVFMFSGDEVHKKVKFLSGGEKARLALCKLLLHQYNFLILDEPTNHLDIKSKEVLKSALLDFEGTLLVVSHDRDFLKGLADPVMELQPGRLLVYPGSIDEFLERRKADNIREYERVKSSKSTHNPTQRKSSEKERWALSKQVASLERDVEKLEDKINLLEEKSAALDYSDAEAVQRHMNEMQNLRRKLEQKMEEWEKRSAELDEHG
jgi:ATP-binding cassette subfamily F protein 3